MSKAVEARLAATVILARDAGDSMELFMVVRHHQIDFASGRLGVSGRVCHCERPRSAGAGHVRWR